MSAAPIDKQALRSELVERLRSELEAMERAQAATVEGATSEEAKPENDKDTRALEQSYLARGQARRVEDLRDGLAKVMSMPVRPLAEGARIALGALVLIEEADSEQELWIAAYGGGGRLASGRVQVVTPSSPLGGALIGKQAGDDAEVQVGPKRRSFTIVSVR